MKAGRYFSLLLLTPILTLGSLLAFACSGDEEKPAATATSAATDAPEAIDISGVPELEDGVLTIGSDIAYAPIEFYEEGTQNEMGLDVDIINAMAVVLGVEVEFQQVADFGGIVGDLTSKRYDIVMSAISITPEREAEIDFIPYFGPAGTGILVKKGNPEGILSMTDLCGKAVAVQSGTFQVDQVRDDINQDECAGNPIDLREFPDNPSSVQELTLGRVVGQLSDDPVAAYAALQSNEVVEVSVTGFDSAPYGIGVRKDSTALKAVLEAALQRIIDDGDYADILEDWGQGDLALQ